MHRRIVMIGLLALVAILTLTACGGVETAELMPVQPVEPPASTPEETYHFNQILDLDAIPPVYEPIFIAPDQADLADDQLVLGVAIDGQAKAYPITVLNGREMVNDELAGIPILATW